MKKSKAHVQKQFRVVAQNLTDTSQVPKGKQFLYRCKSCGTIVPSIPQDNIGCQCGNFFIDIDYFRLAVRDFSTFEVVEEISERTDGD